MLSVEEARTRVLAAFSPLQAEQISLIDGLGRDAIEADVGDVYTGFGDGPGPHRV